MLDLSRTTFLLGSGISLPSDYPSTSDLTRGLLSKNWSYTRDQAISPVPLESSRYWEVYPLRIEATMGLVRLLKSHIDQHLALLGKGEPTYEDVYYLARQLLDSLVGEYDNPALLPLTSDLRDKVSIMAANLNAAYGLNGILNREQQHSLHDLLTACITFVEESVAAQLAVRMPTKGLQLIEECLDSIAGGTLHIATLNHDTLLETHFSSRHIVDGFVPMFEGASIFSPDSLSVPADIRLLKLHGSINWYQYKPKNGHELAMKVTSPDPYHLKGQNGEDLLPPVSRLLLAGTTNKELGYGSGIFLELLYQFQRTLKESRNLIVSGYGFGDKGINNRIWAWVDSNRENRLVVLHADIGQLRNSAKLSFKVNMDRLTKEKRFTLVDKWMCDCCWEDIIREIRISK